MHTTMLKPVTIISNGHLINENVLDAGVRLLLKTFIRIFLSSISRYYSYETDDSSTSTPVRGTSRSKAEHFA
jgi:hypothetical protein